MVLKSRLRAFFLLLALSATLCFIVFSEEAMSADAKYPTKPINMIIGFRPGGALDTMGRGMAPYLQKHIGVSVTVQNRTGAGGANANNYLYGLKPDGYNVLVGMSDSAIYFKTYKESHVFPDFLKAFIPVASWLNDDGNAIFTYLDSPFKTFDDVVNASKTRRVTIGFSGGMGSSDHAIALLINKSYKTNLAIVPYESGGDTVAAIMGKHVDVGIVGLSSEAADPERMRCLATTLGTRFVTVKDAPTFTELGHPDLEMGFHVGMFVRTGTPDPIIAKLEGALQKGFNDPAFQEWAKKTGKPIGDFWGRKQFTTFMAKFDKDIDAIIPLLRESLKEVQTGTKK